MKFQDLKRLRTDHLKAVHDITLYPYQEVISDRILAALIHNLNITRNSTPEDVEQLEQQELAFEISRQAGKTFCVGLTVEFIMTWVAYQYKRPVRVGVFAPQIDQARLSYEITRRALRPIKGLIEVNAEEQQVVREEENSKKLVLPDGSSCLVAPINTVSKIEGLTLDLIIVDEAQLANDEVLTHSIFPMGKTTNAPRVFIGKAGTQKCRFYDLSKTNKTYKAYFEKVAEERRKTYEITGDARHLIYEQSVKKDIEKLGLEEDEIQREYFGKWQIGTGQFTTMEELERITEDRQLTHSDKHNECYAGIDTAKHPDSTVVTIIRYNPKTERKELINWLELRGENYKNQFEIIKDFLMRYKVMAVAIDSTGQGQFMPDWFKEDDDMEWADEHSGLYEIKFSQGSKDAMYRNLKVSIKDFLTSLPNASTKVSERFLEQMLDLQQQYKGQYLSVSHPDDPKAHDDFCDSWALAEWAYAKWNESNDASISVVNITEKERKPVKNDEGIITDYWPDLE